MQDFLELKYFNLIETPLKFIHPDPINDIFIENFISNSNPIPRKNSGLDSLDDCPFYYRSQPNPADFEFSNLLRYKNFNQVSQNVQEPYRILEIDSNFNSMEYDSQTKLDTNEKVEYISNLSFSNNSTATTTATETFKINANPPIKLLKESKSLKLERSKKICKKNKKKKNSNKKTRRLSERLKNIVKNYGKNCASFAIGPIADSIIRQLLTQEEIPRFKEYIKNKIPKITNIRNFRELLLATEADQPEIAKFKQAFQNASEIFIVNYSVNWIFHSSRINDVKNHLFARFKMLRRIKDPKNFTYIH